MVIEVNSTEFYVMSFAVAVSLIALLFGKKEEGPASTEIVPMALNPCVTCDDGLVALHALDDGTVMLLRNGIPLPAGDTVNVVATTVGDKLRIVEKKGLSTHAASDDKLDGTAQLRLPAKTLHVRYESELTGEWALFSFTNHAGRTATAHLKL
ncbi:MAG: hypothetical protein KBT13_08265 [Bacteroidales bacterium]|nr:hypothetical protein [Candidatus Sodaliphilus limicaballi]